MNEFETRRIEMMNRLRWMRILRFSASIFVLFLYFGLFKLKIFVFPVAPFISLCLAEGVLNQPYPFIVKRIRNIYDLAFFNLFMDIVLISFILHFIGGIEISFFNAIYPLVIISSAMVLSKKETFRITLWASAFFAGLVGLEYFGLVPHVPVLSLSLQGDYQLGIVMINIIFFYFVAFLATYSQSVLDEKGRQVQAARDYAENLLGHMRDGLIVVDLDGTIRNVNKAVEKTLKFSGEELIGGDFATLLCPEDRRGQMRNTISNFRVIGELVNFETDLMTKAGGITPVRIGASLVNGLIPGFSGILIIFHDIVPEREAEKVKAVFLSNLSHELNTPLSTIKGFARILLERKELPDAEREEFLKIMDEEAERLERIIVDLMELARMEVGWLKIKKDRGQLLDVIKEVTDGFAPLAREKKLIFHVDLPEKMTPIYFDPENIRRALHHLIENAFRFTPVGEVSVVAEENTDNVEISVSDTGVVIPENELPRVFEQFCLDKEKRPTINKMNIRLPVVKHIIASHGGSIWAKSRPDEGTMFTVVLPKTA